MNTALTVFLTSLSLFILVALMVGREEKRGQRFFLVRVRTKLDDTLETVFRKVSLVWDHFAKYLLQLGWYYSLHSLLRALLRLVVAMYEYLERKFERNRLKAKNLKHRRNQVSEGHLSEVAAHKAEVALSPEEEEELKERKLSESD